MNGLLDVGNGGLEGLLQVYAATEVSVFASRDWGSLHSPCPMGQVASWSLRLCVWDCGFEASSPLPGLELGGKMLPVVSVLHLQQTPCRSRCPRSAFWQVQLGLRMQINIQHKIMTKYPIYLSILSIYPDRNIPIVGLGTHHTDFPSGQLLADADAQSSWVRSLLSHSQKALDKSYEPGSKLL